MEGASIPDGQAATGPASSRVRPRVRPTPAVPGLRRGCEMPGASTKGDERFLRRSGRRRPVPPSLPEPSPGVSPAERALILRQGWMPRFALRQAGLFKGAGPRPKRVERGPSRHSADSRTPTCRRRCRRPLARGDAHNRKCRRLDRGSIARGPNLTEKPVTGGRTSVTRST